MRTLLLTRPEPGAGRSAERARAMGITALVRPLFEIRPLAWRAPDPQAYDALLLTSANAIRHGGAELAALHGLPLIAVGPATARAARGAGFEVMVEGVGGVDDALAAVPSAWRLLHLAGRGTTAVERPLDRLVVYAAEIVGAFATDDLAGAVVALHSPRAAGEFARRVYHQGPERAAIALVTLSRAVADAAGDGWETVLVAQTPTDAALLALAAPLCL